METKSIAIWLDHSKAYLMEKGQESIQTLYSEHDRHEREDGEGSDKTSFGAFSSNNENRKEHRFQEILNNYFKSIEKVLANYQRIFILGAGIAKQELQNRLANNSAFSGKEIQVESLEELPENQLKAYVRTLFAKTGK